MKEFNDFYVKERYMMYDATCRTFFRKDKGTEIDKILPPMSRFDGGNRFVKKSQVTERIQKLFYKYFGLR